jgi:ribosome biogenesis SPOUT family RNA methylase Rps3
VPKKQRQRRLLTRKTTTKTTTTTTATTTTRLSLTQLDRVDQPNFDLDRGAREKLRFMASGLS